MTIDEILDEIENLVVEARRVPFTNKCVIEDDDIVRLIDDLRTAMPQEIQEANHLMQERQVILNDAKKEANKIVDQAKSYAEKLTREHEIVKQAQAQAEEITKQTQVQAEEIMSKTIQSANSLKNDSMKYADEVFDHLVRNVSSTLEVVKQAKEQLNGKQ